MCGRQIPANPDSVVHTNFGVARLIFVVLAFVVLLVLGLIGKAFQRGPGCGCLVLLLILALIVAAGSFVAR